MRVIKTLKDLRTWRAGITDSLGFVPTMGALHAGHLSLAEKSLLDNEKTIVSIFVNPTQFAPHEDFDSYPRTIEQDCARLEKIGVDAIWAPDLEEIYPSDFNTIVSVSGITQILEGAFRPTHFDGVTTIVNKLFMQVQPTRAYFGEKDYQQLMVINKMVKDLNIPVQVVGCPIVRDGEGLALSSRNAYLSPSELEIARHLNVILKQASDLAHDHTIKEIEQSLTQDILDSGFTKVDYVAVRCARSLEEITHIKNQDTRILVAAFLGSVRLIDNQSLKLIFKKQDF